MCVYQSAREPVGAKTMALKFGLPTMASSERMAETSAGATSENVGTLTSNCGTRS